MHASRAGGPVLRRWGIDPAAGDEPGARVCPADLLLAAAPADLTAAVARAAPPDAPRTPPWPGTVPDGGRG